MRTLKSKGGFTLVELIVVIAILAILAGVAIPVYNGYIKKAQDASAVTELDAIATAAQAANSVAGGITGISVEQNEAVAGQPRTATVTVTADKFDDDYESDFVMFCDGASAITGTDEMDFTVKIDLSASSYAEGATWTRTGGWAK